MVSYILLIIGLILLFVSVINILIKYIKYKKINNDDISGYDICKLLIDKHKISDISIIETKDSGKNTYNINRRVIKLSYSCYYGKDCFSLGISTFIAGFCILHDMSNRYISYIGRVFSKIWFVSISSIIVLIVSYLFRGYYSFVGLILLIILFVYQYFKKCISNDIISVVNKEIDDMNNFSDNIKNGIKSVVSSIDFSYNVSLVITILQICRLFIYIIL